MIRTPHWGVHNNVLSSDLTLNLYCFLESLLKDHPPFEIQRPSTKRHVMCFARFCAHPYLYPLLDFRNRMMDIDCHRQINLSGTQTLGV